MDLLAVYDSSSDDEGNKNDNMVAPRAKVNIADSKSQKVLFTRSVPHVRGNWAGHVFLRLDEQGLHGLARRSISTLQRLLETAGWEGTIVSHVPRTTTESGDDSSCESGSEHAAASPGDLHVSLSRPFYLQLASIQSFVADLKDSLSHERAMTLVVGGPKVLVNDDGTRTFWSRSVEMTQSARRLLHQVDEVMLKYKQPTYYDPPLMHVSLASVPGNVESILSRGLKQLKEESDDEEGPILVRVCQVHCTFGTTKEFSIDLIP